jgi:hypothetical protein
LGRRTPDLARTAYKEAIARNDKDWFALSSGRAQLTLLKELGFRPDAVGVGIATFERAIEKLRRPEESWEARQVLLFSGHRIDTPDRETPRFPNEKAGIAGERIAEALDQLGAGPDDLALCQASAGGDLLFLEACQKRGVHCHVHLPFSEAEFVAKSIVPSQGGERWRDRHEGEARGSGRPQSHARGAEPVASRRQRVRAL